MANDKWAFAAVLSLLAAAGVEGILPSVIRIAAVFDDDQDAKHELAFRQRHSYLLCCHIFSLSMLQGRPSGQIAGLG